MNPTHALLICCLLSPQWLHAKNENFDLVGGPPGAFESSRSSSGITFENRSLKATFTTGDGHLRLGSLSNPQTKESLPWQDPNLFTFRLGNKEVSSSSMRMKTGPKVVDLAAVAADVNLAKRSPGKALTADFSDEATGLQVRWSAVFREDSNYLRQEIEVTTTTPVDVKEIEMIRTALPAAEMLGYTDGSPVGSGNWIIGLEHPMAKTTVNGSGGWSPADMEANRISRPVSGLKPGPCIAKFTYTEGNHGINITKVALVSNGKILSEDVHPGFSGTQSRQNEYSLVVPAGVETATLEATLSNPAGQYQGSGSISLSNGSTASGVVTATLPRGFTLTPGVKWKVSTHITASTPGQKRRDFAYYLQRERAHPYRQYWHYNSWYDLNINRNDLDDPVKRMNEEQCLEVIRAFDLNLYQKHRVGINGFVWDDGWDDWNTLWGFHKGFPNGFTKLNEAARKQGAKMGAWLSPWGGYGRSKNMRVEYGKAHGYETNGGGFSLGGPKYRAAFRDTCVKMIHDYEQNYFKFDGIGSGTWATGAPAGIAKDLDGLVSVTEDLRKENPQVFINCTVGTWASPYWTRFADSIWRQGEDMSFAGKGNPREQWINYKDGITYRRFASQSPLFPVNSLMYHGLVVGPVASPGRMPDPAANFESYCNEVRMMAGYASGLGELYLTPRLMNEPAWAVLAECIRWARENQALLADSHWIGGNPEKHEIYGFAAWRLKLGGVITLRNPDDKPQSITLDLAKTWEIPSPGSTLITLKSPWATEKDKPTVQCSMNQPLVLTLKPFEVLTLQTR